MGFSATLVGYPAPTVRAAVDLRAMQYRGVRIMGGGVNVAAATVNATSGAIYILQNKPNSGEDCTLLGPPNVSKCVAGDAVSLGAWVTIDTSGCVVAQTSYQYHTEPLVGTAWEAAAAAGDEIAVQLR